MNFIDTNVIYINDKKFFKSKILFEIYNQKKFYQKLQIIKESRIKLNNIYFEVEKDLSIDDFVINKLIINKETANTSLEKTKDLTNLIDINEINKLKNWIELKKFLAHKFSEISKIN